jgi:3-dehydroquinate dehydratase/shikimate dehydrogenase
MSTAPLLCVTVKARTTAELRRIRDEVASDADLVELRVDSVSDPDVAGALEGRRGKTIVTVRPKWEGGDFAGSEEERVRLLSDAIALGADYVDLEWRARPQLDNLIARTTGRGIVLSLHDFTGVPADLPGEIRAMRSTGAEVVKVAVTATCLSDCAELLRLSHPGDRDEPGSSRQIVIAMGDYGVATRVVAARFGSAWTYAGSIQEIGQLTARSLLVGYRFRSITSSTRVYGVVARSVTHSVSPAMHNAAFQAANLNAVFLPLPATSADDFVRFGRAIDIAGASVTIPFKVPLCAHVDALCPVAERVGALNTIRVDDGRWMGTNTDVGGFLLPLQEALETWRRSRSSSARPPRAAVLGAGGAARAVVVGLAETGAAIRVHARDPIKAEAAIAGMPVEIGPWPPEPGSWDLLVNCTPVGMFPHVDDLIYNPTPTRLLRDAAEAGCQTIGGLDMLVAQAHEQFQWWTGIRPAPGVMRAAAITRLAEFTRNETHNV